ncbi:alpha/beta hydrolase family protein [Polyangium sp. y55x31]|uniref:alpha/beta hydrolase family protein n=1 Tax=Polyangium sp. y55x31 TaxID=3042688 RepID=UPI002482679F|nr:alpha/beta hydrolase family protein [Polyangium sp. y55x31]MDI1479367.1 alpha/beta hydrolase family protein [Polyangium sp. y55x31]
MRIHWLDALFARVVLSRTPRYFSDGWGPLSELDALVEPPRTPVDLHDLTLGPVHREGPLLVQEGRFGSPAARELMPPACREACFQLVLPAGAGARPAVCLLLAASGDEGFGRRRSLAKDLARHGIGALLLENPYYGARRPPGQPGVAVRTVIDLLLMFRAAAIESLALLRWLRARGHDRLGISGFSMGGSLAAYTAALSKEPLAVIPVAAAHAIAPIFEEGVLSDMADWRALGSDVGACPAIRRRLCDVLAPASITALPPPPALRSAILLAAREDGFVPPSSTTRLAEHWRGAEVRHVPGGHVSASLIQRKAIVHAVLDAFSRLEPSAVA